MSTEYTPQETEILKCLSIGKGQRVCDISCLHSNVQGEEIVRILELAVSRGHVETYKQGGQTFYLKKDQKGGFAMHIPV